MKNMFKNYGFWVSLSSAVVVLVEAIGRACGFIPDGQLVNDIIMSVAGVLVVLGVVTMPNAKTDKTKDNKTDETNEIKTPEENDETKNSEGTENNKEEINKEN